MNRAKGFFSLLSCGFLLACFGLLVKILNQYIGAFTQVGGRMLIAGLLIIPYFFFKKISLRTKTENKLLFGIFVLSFPLYIIFFTLSIINTTAINAFFYLFASTMLASFLIGNLYFNEKIKTKSLVAAFLLIIGLLFMIYPFNLSQSWKGISSGIIGGVLYAVSNATRKVYADKINRWLVSFYQMLTGTMLAFIIATFLNEFPHNQLTSMPLVLLVCFGIGLALIQVLLFSGFKNFPLNLGSIVLASQLLFIEIFGALILKEVPTSTEITGSLLIFLAIIVSNFSINGFREYFNLRSHL